MPTEPTGAGNGVREEAMAFFGISMVDPIQVAVQKAVVKLYEVMRDKGLTDAE